ncbi:MAG: divalent metal cation transporter [Candidatus Yanofskybacteria bacterium]|nr:divalent metal cation transporter [Candidatus Yanofskybacteria bacterium]
MFSKTRALWKSIGPGLVVGASDDDPSALASYSLAGARYGYAMLWVLVFMLPFMVALQEMSARIGALSGCGLAGNLKRHYPKFFLLLVAIIMVLTNTLNIGANIYGMAGGLNLVLPIPIQALALILSAIILILVIFLDYEQITNLFKWVALSLFAYVFAFFMVKANWSSLIFHSIIPSFSFNRNYILLLFAVIGTSFSPYLYFWQASEEAEGVRLNKPRIRVCKFRTVSAGTLQRMELDTKLGMLFSNLISFFVIALTAATIFQGGNPSESLRDIAQALQPIAGQYAYLLFTIGLLGSGLLSIPVLAGSAAYVVSEIFGWEAGFNKHLAHAKEFYCVVIASIAAGLFIPFLGIAPLQALYYTSILNGLITPILIVFVIHMANNKDIVGPYATKPVFNYLGIISFFIMITGTIYVFVS